MPTILGVNYGRDFFWGEGAEILEKQGRKTRGTILRSTFAEKFAGNFQKFAGPEFKNHPKAALQNLGFNT